MQTKACNKCIHSKLLSEFYRDKSTKDGLMRICKECSLACTKEYQKNNKTAISAQRKIYKKENYEQLRVYQINYNAENINARRKTRNAYNKRKRAECPQFKIAGNLRTRLGKKLKQKTKLGSHIKDLGCSVEFLRGYLEAQFQPGMTWANHGFYGWHIDHIIPLDSFNLENREEFLRAVHYTNLQPLWALENLIKNDKVA